MWRRDLLVVLIALTLAGCDRRSDLGGQKQNTACARDCDAVDAGQGLLDAGVSRPGPRFASGTPGDMAAFVASVEGLWWGVALDSNTIVDDVDTDSLFEISFVRGVELDQGTFHVRCLKQSKCDPFGSGSATADGGTFRMLNLDPVGGGVAQGELVWLSERAPERRVASFRNMQRDEAGGPALTFELGFPNGGPRSRVARRVVLGFGPWPEGSGTTPVVDSGVADGGAP